MVKRPGPLLPLIRFPSWVSFTGCRKGHWDDSVAPVCLWGKGWLLDGLSRQAGCLRAAVVFLALARPQGQGRRDEAASEGIRGALNSRGLGSEASRATPIALLPSRFRFSAELPPAAPRAAPAAPVISNRSTAVSSAWEKGPLGSWFGFALVKKVADVPLGQGPSEPAGAERQRESDRRQLLRVDERA